MSSGSGYRSVVGCGCLIVVITMALAATFLQPIASIAHWMNWLPIQLLTSALLVCSVAFVFKFPIDVVRAKLNGQFNDEHLKIGMQGLIIVAITCGLLYLMWLAIGAKKHDPTKPLPEFRGLAKTNNAQLEDGVYIFECPNLILGQSHWGIWIPNCGGFELSGEKSRWTSGLDYSNPYWRELLAEPTCNGITFSAMIPVATEDVVQAFNSVRGVDQLHWDANNNCKTQSLQLIASNSDVAPDEICVLYCGNLDTSFSSLGLPLVTRENADCAPWYSRRAGSMIIVIVIQPLVILILWGVLLSLGVTKPVGVNDI